MITQEELKQNLKYDPETGIFVWIVSSNGRIQIGDVAGGIDGKGYSHIQIYRKLYRSHRLAWLYVYGKFPSHALDHIDGNKTNNKISNLRECTLSENSKNIKMNKNNKSGFKGVSWSKCANKWMATGKIDGKPHYLGLFINPEEASNAYQEFSKQYHGDFYRNTTDSTHTYNDPVL